MKTCYFPYILGQKLSEADWLEVHADQEYVLQVQLNRVNRQKVSSQQDYTYVIKSALECFSFLRFSQGILLYLSLAFVCVLVSLILGHLLLVYIVACEINEQRMKSKV